jgi:hypothetical protein
MTHKDSGTQGDDDDDARSARNDEPGSTCSQFVSDDSSKDNDETSVLSPGISSCSSSSKKKKKKQQKKRQLPTTTTIVLPNNHDELMKLPVKQLCLRSGTILRTFPTAKAAHESVSKSIQSRRYFGYVLRGEAHQGSTPHVYKGHFWRVMGLDITPTDISSTTTTTTTNPTRKAKKLRMQ